jgi:uncharacterized protein (DUF3820 family)
MKPDDLVKLVTTPMPFGKHKGMLIADLPGNYLNWFAREGFPKSEIGQLLRLMQEIDHNGRATCSSRCAADSLAVDHRSAAGATSHGFAALLC